MNAEEKVTPFELVGGEVVVRALVARFYDHMDAHEPALSRLHETDERGHVAPAARERFTLFLIGWLGGPQDYVARHGHPRLRMRHARVPVNEAMREAWLRCMRAALEAQGVAGPVRAFLEERFADVAAFLRNVEG